MIVENIHIENFKGLRDEFVEFDKSSTVLAGRNGGGKSTVLEAVATMLSWLPVGLCNYALKGRKINSRDITYGADFSRLTMTLRNKTQMKLTLYKEREKRTSKLSNMTAANSFARDMRVMLDSDESIQIPVLAYYGASRDTSGYTSPKPISTNDRTEVYKRAFQAGTNFDKLTQWFVEMGLRREKEMAEASKMPLKKGNARRLEIDAFFNPLKFVSKALSLFAEEFGTFAIQDGKMFLQSRKIPAENLSDGEKTIIALISDIAMRMIVANPKMKNPLESDAIILIDELDLHLHPDWQSSIAKKLPSIFKKAQFIISSHSPSVMSVAKNLYKIDGKNNTFEKIDNAYGRSPADILSQLLNIHREPEIAKRLRAMYTAIDNGNFQTAQQIVDELNIMIPEDPEVLRGEYLIRALS
ncbi:MAG: AAA family ATPase [Opitutales bacterium]|nr:AAA family ATPase [Opitutales bacterium]